ncbi:MAG: helix-turn-helix transcriptional regulator [Lachnospiraceae bacterium]|nr:helix-turn-helix transcriptional regulator [Lachnospiraceae bacterium]
MKAFVTINERIKDLRVERGFNQHQIAEAIEIPDSTYGDYELDGYLIPHTAVMQIAEYFDVSADYLLGMTDIRKNGDISLQSLHLSDDAIDTIINGEINQRLLSEIISHPAFNHFLMDTEIYVDGFFEESLQSNNTLIDFARKEISRKYGDTEDSVKGSLNLIHLHQDDYFSQILAKDLLPILEDIKDAHRDDNETSDGGYTMDELEQIADAARNGGNKISSLIAALSTALRIKRTPKNEEAAEKLLSGEAIDHNAVAELLGQSKIVEPNARKRRRKR